MSPDHIISRGLNIALLGGILALFSTLLFPHFLIGLIISLMIFAFGSALAFSPSHRIAIESCTEPMGARMAVFSTLQCISGVIGGILVSLTYTGGLLWFGIILFILASLACLIRWLSKDL